MKFDPKYLILAFILVIGLSPLAHAVPCSSVNPNCKPASAPEVDPGLVVVGASLLAGSLAVLRARRPR
jgi:hypothetical protein